jgi:hypothetical protein
MIGDQVILTVLRVHGSQVRVGIAAPHPAGRRHGHARNQLLRYNTDSLAAAQQRKYGGFHDCTSENPGVIFEL